MMSAMSGGSVERSIFSKLSMTGLRPGKAGSAGRTITWSSSIHTPLGTLTTPNSSSTMCASSSSEGCWALARSTNSLVASTPPTSRATVTTSNPFGWRSSRSSCHTGRSKRQPHHDAQASSSTFCPRRLERRKRSPVRRSGSSSSGAWAVVRARRSGPAAGPRAHSPWVSSCTRGMPARWATALTSSVLVSPSTASAGRGRQTSPWHRPWGCTLQPVRASKSSIGVRRLSRSTAVTVAFALMDEQAFRAEVRAALSARLQERRAGAGFSFLGAGQDDVEAGRSLLATLADGGWSVPTWPAQWGGRDATPEQAAIIAQELSRFDVPDLYPFMVGLSLVGPTLLTHGTDSQNARWLPAIASGDEIWCQLFSEPDAGSDLAALSSRAVLDGDVWRVSGQKVWSSRAHYSAWGLLLARTDADVPKHAGITAFALRMDAPGVEVRPLQQMNGDTH